MSDSAQRARIWNAPTRLPLLVGALAILVLLALNSGSASAAPGDSTADRVFGQGGSFASGTCNLGGSDTSICNPWGVAVDSGGRLWVADSNNDRILEYDSPLSSSVATRIIPTGASTLPTGIVLDGTGRLYVAISNSRILEYDTPLTSPAISRTLNLPGGTVPLGLAIDSAGRLYLGDVYFSRFLEIDDPVNTSTINRNVALPGAGAVGTGVAVDAAGHLFIADAGRHRVLEYDHPLTSSTPDRVIGQPGLGTGSCNQGGLSASSLCGTLGISLDSSGNLFVADTNNARVLRYNNPLGACASCDATADQVFGQATMTTNACGLGATGLCGPQDVAVDGSGRVWIADSTNNRVLEYDGTGCVSTPNPLSGAVGAGGTLTTDTGGTGATTCQVMQVSVTSPNAGNVSINITVNPGPIQKQAQITAPGASSAHPLTLVFTLDASLIPAGANQNTLAVFKDGARAFDCIASGGAAGPDPCVASRAALPAGDIQFTVLTSSASVWSFAPVSSIGGTVDLPTTNGSSSATAWLLALGGLAALVVYGGWRLRIRRR